MWNIYDYLLRTYEILTYWGKKSTLKDHIWTLWRHKIAKNANFWPFLNFFSWKLGPEGAHNNKKQKKSLKLDEFWKNEKNVKKTLNFQKWLKKFPKVIPKPKILTKSKISQNFCSEWAHLQKSWKNQWNSMNYAKLGKISKKL